MRLADSRPFGCCNGVVVTKAWAHALDEADVVRVSAGAGCTTQQPMPSAPHCALELRDVHKKFGAAHVIRGVTLAVPRGERHAIIGPNGAGKSTLFNLISGRFAPTRGAIRLNGVEVAGQSPFELYRRGLSRSFQVTNIYPRLSVYENIRCSLLWSLGYRYNFWRRVAPLRDVNESIERTLEQIGTTAPGEDALAGVLT